jgi:hypothetical protein
MEVLRNGKFSFAFTQKDLMKGIKREKNASRNTGSFSSVSGMIGNDGSLESLPDLTAIDTSVITDDFPYPQLFVYTNYVIICDATKIYEYTTGGGLVAKVTVSAGSTWKAVDFYNYVVLSNEKVVVVRDPLSQAYAVDSDLDVFSAICNYNGQVMIGAPGVNFGTSYTLSLASGSYSLTGSAVTLT